jgi:hypothetical protein
LSNDVEFQLDLKIIASELDMSKYVNYKSQAFMKLIRKAYMIHQENEAKKVVNNVLNNPDKLNEIINLKI